MRILISMIFFPESNPIIFCYRVVVRNNDLWCKMKKSQNLKPFAYTELAVFLRKRIRALRRLKTQTEIAVEAGWTNSRNMLAMITSGASKLPIDRVPALARALNVDPAFLLRLAILQHDRELWSIIEQATGKVLSKNEEELIEHIRSMSRASDFHPSSQLLDAIREVLEK